MINRRQMLSMGVIFSGIGATTAIANTPNKELTRVTQFLLHKIDEWKQETNAKIRFYDDPTMHKQRRYGIYGWYEGSNTPSGVKSTSIDWKIEVQEDSNVVLQQLVDYYGGRVTEVYDGKKRGGSLQTNRGQIYYQAFSTNLDYQKVGYIAGIEV